MKTNPLHMLPLALVLVAAGCGRGDGDEDLMLGTEAGENVGERGVISKATHEGTGNPAKAVEPGPGTFGESSGTADMSDSIGSGVEAQGGGGPGVADPIGDGDTSEESSENPTTEDGAGSDPGDN